MRDGADTPTPGRQTIGRRSHGNGSRTTGARWAIASASFSGICVPAAVALSQPGGVGIAARTSGSHLARSREAFG
jgi:hypothetical protein